MRTATVRELRNHYSSVLGWVEGGEEVAISKRGVIIARLVPEKPKLKKVDWTKSAALTMDRTGMRTWTAEETSSIIADSRGDY